MERTKKIKPPIDPSLKLYQDFGTNLFRTLPNYKMAFIMGNWKYTDKKLSSNRFRFEEFVETDTGNIKNWLLQSCEFKNENIFTLDNKNASDSLKIYKKFKEEIWQKRQKLKRAHEEIFSEDEDEKLLGGKCGLLIFVYYSGHGVMSEGHTYAVCPDYDIKNPKKTAVVDFDSIVGQLAAIPDTFVVSLLDCCREQVDNFVDEKEKGTKKQARDYFGGDSVRIYATSAGTAAIERCEKKEKGSKITCKFIKHATTYGFPDFPNGTSFNAFLQVCSQYQVEAKRNCTKSIHLTSVSTMDIYQTYQRMFLMTHKEIDFLYKQFKRMLSRDKKTKIFSLSPKELVNDLTVFGFNYPPEFEDDEPNQKKNIKMFLENWRKEVEKIQLDEDTSSISFDAFLLLFVRSQTNLHWNNLLPHYLKEKKKLPFL